jgi:hypothetical protein
MAPDTNSMKTGHNGPFTFHKILRAPPGHGFLARDVITGEEQEVLQRSGSKRMQADDILFGQLVDMESTQLALDALKHLAFDDSDEDLPSSAEHDSRGQLRSVRITRTKPGNRMRASWARAARIGDLEHCTS